LCGILGFVRQRPIDPDRFRAACAGMAHRGPDAQDCCFLDGAAFGHALLSIIGDRAVPQPIATADGQGLLVFNGEVYNYLELFEEDAELRAACAGRPRSDTVVLAEGLRRHGAAFLPRLNGMFALAYFDRGTGRTLLARDRLGIKPLHYTTAGGGVAFASETRSLRLLLELGHQPDPLGYYGYVRFRYPVFGGGYDARIRQLEPGALIEVDADGIRASERWWRPRVEPDFDGSRGEAVERVRELLEDSVRLRMRSDHSFCTFLSGGLDSSLLTALAARSTPVLDSYSIGIEGAEGAAMDESAWAAEAAAAVGTRHHPYRLGAEEYRAEHAALVRHLEEPVGVPNQVALSVLSRELARDHRVVLSGEGADEVFGGYGRIFLLPHDWRAIEAGPTGELGAKLRARFGEPLPAGFAELFLRRYGYTDHAHARALLAPMFPAAELDALEERLLQIFAARLEPSCAAGLHDRLLQLFQEVHLPGLLARADLASMAHSVEARVPFLDHELVEFVNRLPFAWKVIEHTPRADLRRLLGDEISEVHDEPKAPIKEIARRHLPAGVVDRRKVGFPIPPAFYSEGEPAQGGYASWTRRNLELLQEIL